MGFAYGHGKYFKDAPLAGKKGMLCLTTGAWTAAVACSFPVEATDA